MSKWLFYFLNLIQNSRKQEPNIFRPLCLLFGTKCGILVFILYQKKENLLRIIENLKKKEKKKKQILKWMCTTVHHLQYQHVIQLKFHVPGPVPTIFVQAEVLGGAILQQTFVVEFTVAYQMCPDCHRVEAKVNWVCAFLQLVAMYPVQHMGSQTVYLATFSIVGSKERFIRAKLQCF